MLFLNILIRQMMINIIAVFMHSDYHNSKRLARENQVKRNEEQRSKIEEQVKIDYKKKEKVDNA